MKSISLLPIDVGFDVRTTGHAVFLPLPDEGEDKISLTYATPSGRTRTIEDNPVIIALRLRASGICAAPDSAAVRGKVVTSWHEELTGNVFSAEGRKVKGHKMVNDTDKEATYFTLEVSCPLWSLYDMDNCPAYKKYPSRQSAQAALDEFLANIHPRPLSPGYPDKSDGDNCDPYWLRDCEA